MFLLNKEYFKLFIFINLIYFALNCSNLNAQITVNTVRVTASFNHILVGVYINPGTNVNSSMNVTYRKVGTTQWFNSHPALPSTNDPF